MTGWAERDLRGQTSSKCCLQDLLIGNYDDVCEVSVCASGHPLDLSADHFFRPSLSSDLASRGWLCRVISGSFFVKHATARTCD